MTRAFPPDALAACERRGRHVYAWVPTWHGIGYGECACGRTTAVRERDHVADAGKMVVVPGVSEGERDVREGLWIALDDLRREIVDPARKRGRPPGIPMPTARSERNAEIRALFAAGHQAPELAQRFGLATSRIYQIAGTRAQARRQAVGS